MAQNEVKRLREQIRLEGEAAERGLSGFAIGISRHDFIEMRATRGADHILQLIEEGKPDQAIAFMDMPDWGEGQGKLRRGEMQDAGSSIL